MFRGFRIKKSSTDLDYRLEKIESLEKLRARYVREQQKGMALACNYEIVSHASRALTDLRKLEELRAFEDEGDPESVRAFLRPRLELPCIPRDSVETAPVSEIKQKYDQWRSSTDQNAYQYIKELESMRQKRMEELDEKTASALVLQLRAQVASEGLTIDGIHPEDYPMPMELQIRLIRLAYGLVGPPFDGFWWYGQMVALWLLMSRELKETGTVDFDYRDAVENFRAVEKPREFPEPVVVEAAYGNICGAIYTALTGNDYDARVVD